MSTPTLEPTAEDVRERQIYRSFGLTDAEYEQIAKRLGRLPNYVETGIASVMWSEHCSYKSSRRILRRFPSAGSQVLQGPGENAGIVDIGDGQAAVFKIESHNHPTAIEPFQGAATGVGGIIRDVFTMGARPIALLNSLRFGPLDDAHNRYLFGHSVAGIGGYGNCIGIPTVGGEVVFDERYTQNPLVNAMCVGLISHAQIATGAASGVGNPVLVVGAKTGRDGIHGATFASTQDPHAKERSAVQVGDPFMEKLLMEACLELIATGKVVGIQDMGAAGMTSSSAEMASRAGSGIRLDMQKVPRRETGMTPYEIMLSESQERMLVVMQRGEEQVADAVFAKWGLDATVIGEVTDDGMLTITEGRQIAAQLPVALLVDEAPVLTRPSSRPAYLDALLPGADAVVQASAAGDFTDDLLALLAQPTIASKEWVYQQYDSMVRTETFVRPGSDAAVVGVPGTAKALAMTTDGNGRQVYLDPYAGGALAVAEAARNLVCSGATPLAVTDCLNYGNPEKPETYYLFERSVDGMSDACRAFGTPVISGNVSLYNETAGVDIYPTPVVGMVGVVADRSHITTSAFGTVGARVLLLGDCNTPLTDGLGGSEYLAMRAPEQKLAYALPAFDLTREQAVQATCLAVIQAGLVQGAHDVSDGGLMVALTESAIAGKCGLAIDFDEVLPRTDYSAAQQAALLFGESPSRIALCVLPSDIARVRDMAAAHECPLWDIGEVVASPAIHVRLGGEQVVALSVLQAETAWRGAIAQWMK
ncbi:MAG: phosphoribosylformylglycinamidine synthase subunit PurL [Firmicutes bacterium]|nr:phosphoribosylformylglycinamidine synthase subunit PurL [Bacillota bacterium]